MKKIVFLFLVGLLVLGLVLGIGCQKAKEGRYAPSSQGKPKKSAPPAPILLTPKWSTNKWKSVNIALSNDGKFVYTGWPATLSGKDGSKIWAGDNLEDEHLLASSQGFFGGFGHDYLEIYNKEGARVTGPNLYDIVEEIGSSEEAGFFFNYKAFLSENGQKFFIALEKQYTMTGADYYIVVLDNQGNILWKLKDYYDDSFLPSSPNSVPSFDGQYLFRSAEIGDNDVSSLALFGPDGQRLWQKELGGGVKILARAISSNNSHLAVGLQTTSEEGGVKETRNKIILFKINGEQVWEKDIAGEPVEVELSPQGKYIAVETKPKDSFETTVHLIDKKDAGIKFSTQGDKWQGISAKGANPTFVKNGEYLILIQAGKIKCYDTRGNLVWYTGEGTSFENFKASPDGKFIVASVSPTFSTGEYPPWLYFFDASQIIK